MDVSHGRISRPSRQRFDVPESDWISLRCAKCSKRLGEYFLDTSRSARVVRREGVPEEWNTSQTSDGYWFITADVKIGQKVIHEDWLSVRCKKCNHTWQGRKLQVTALVRDAIQLKRTSAMLVVPTEGQMRNRFPNVPSRQW